MKFIKTRLLFLIPVFLCFFSIEKAFAQTNVIILIDSRVFDNDANKILGFDEIRPDIYKGIQTRLYPYSNDINNTFSLYAFHPESNYFLYRNLFFRKRYTVSGIEKGSDYLDFENSARINSIQELLQKHSDEINKTDPAITYTSTVVLLFNFNSLPNITVNSTATQLTFTDISPGDVLFSKTYNKNDDTTENPVNYTLTIPVQHYRVDKSINVFTGANAGETGIFRSNCDRKTILYDKEQLQLYRENETSLINRLLPNATIRIDECALLDITGVESNASLLNGKPVTFSKGTRPMPQELSGWVPAGKEFPLFDMIKPFLDLKSDTPDDSAYEGRMKIDYTLNDPIYSHAKFSDTIRFRISIDPPISMFVGFGKKVLLNNKELIYYGNRISGEKERTQVEVRQSFERWLTTLKYIIIIILVMIILLLWFFLRKGKKITWKNLVTFYK